MKPLPGTILLFACILAVSLIAGCADTPSPTPPPGTPVQVDLETGDIGPFYETAGAFEDRVIFTFIPTGTEVSEYLVTYEVRVDGTTRASATEKRFEGISASNPIQISVPREEGGVVWISISIATPDGVTVHESSSSIGAAHSPVR
ncbi:hypothetical protein [Methanofollis fontis]|uniref:Lipoprotein n=1 Tax=Methanofollis fontis TaxID=2052832 RepID=A0A483CXF2_9EURY|nr:hypothetical protein [Methanofollis fontis]TAJ43943.1 hypothetical protein CUJ86_07765 [Methanofollis fontis]